MDLAALSNRRLSDVTWVAFDTEATGYSNVTERLVEIAGVKFRFLPTEVDAIDPALPREPEPIPEAAPPPGPPPRVAILGEFSELVNPGIPIPLEVVKIHGITDEMVRDLPCPLDAIERFLAFCEDSVLLAHYAAFDLGAMAFALTRAGKRVPPLASVDTFLLPKRLFPGAPNYALSTLVDYLDLPRAAAHRALPDAVSTMELYRRCVGAMGAPEVLTIADVATVAGPLLTLEQFSEISIELPAELAVIREAIENGLDLTILYRGGQKGAVPRRVTPSHLFAREGSLFLEGYCHLSEAAKSFRIDRIHSATLVPAIPGAPVMRHQGSGHWVREPGTP